MKKVMIITAIALATTSCLKEQNTEIPADKWNGYGKYLKMGEQIHTLWAGKNINVGTVTYGISNDANFYVTYDCMASGWTITETHMFAGDKKLMPRNKPGNPKIGLFPNSSVHNPAVSSFTCMVPLASLPPCEEPGFVVASHCVVKNSSNQKETAWAEGDYKFTDKSWGWYDVFYYNQVENQYTILYCITLAMDSLKLYHMDITNQTAELTYTEYVGNTQGSYDAAAYDAETGLFYFVNVNTGELWVNFLEEEDSSFVAGTLAGNAHSATFNDGIFYYVDASDNTIHGVSLNETLAISEDLILDTIPGSITVNDIAMNPEGDRLFISGQVNQGPTQLISWETATGDFNSFSNTLSSNTQIAFGSDGLLYAISPLNEGGTMSEIIAIDYESGTLTIVEDEIIFIDDPFSDMSGGPVM